MTGPEQRLETCRNGRRLTVQAVFAADLPHPRSPATRLRVIFGHLAQRFYEPLGMQ